MWMEGKNGVKQNPSEENKKNIGRCYSKLLTQFTMKPLSQEWACKQVDERSRWLSERLSGRWKLKSKQMNECPSTISVDFIPVLPLVRQPFALSAFFSSLFPWDHFSHPDWCNLWVIIRDCRRFFVFLFPTVCLLPLFSPSPTPELFLSLFTESVRTFFLRFALSRFGVCSKFLVYCLFTIRIPL